MVLLVFCTVILIVLVGVIVYGIQYYLKIKSYADRVLKTCPQESGGKMLAKTLKSHGTRTIFCLTGGHVIPAIVACEEEGISVISTRDEQNATIAADAVGRFSGKPGIALVTAGPGVTNCVTALKNAQIEESPMILIGGAAPSMLQGRDALQDVDQMKLLRTCCKHVEKVKNVRDVVESFRRAYKICQEGVQGPCFIEIPLDFLYSLPWLLGNVEKMDECDLHDGVKDSDRDPKPQKGIVDKIMDFVMLILIYRVFYNGFHGIDFKPLKLKPESNYQAPRSGVQKVVGMLRNSKKPVILIGSHFLRKKGREDIEMTAKALTDLNIPYFLSGISRGLTGKSPKNSFRHNKTYVLNQADFILLLGISPNYKISYGKCFNPKAKVISVNMNKKTVGKNQYIMWSPTKKFVCSPQSFLIELERHFRPYENTDDSKWYKRLRKIESDTNKEIEKHSMRTTKSGKINHLRLILEMEKALPEDSIVICDGGNSALTASYLLNPRKPLSYMNMMEEKFSLLGVGGGMILGLRYLYPRRPIWVLFGDGTVGWSLAEFETFSRLKMKNLACIVCNDGAWGMIKRIQNAELSDSNIGCVIDQKNYHLCVEGLGGIGLKISKDQEIPESFKELEEKSKKGVAMLNSIAGQLKYVTEGLMKA